MLDWVWAMSCEGSTPDGDARIFQDYHVISALNDIRKKDEGPNKSAWEVFYILLESAEINKSRRYGCVHYNMSYLMKRYVKAECARLFPNMRYRPY